MTAPESLRELLSRTFAQSVDVRAVPSGLSVTAPFSDSSGDRLSFYVTQSDDGYAFEDDGFYLSHLVASGIDIERGQRRQLLDTVLEGSGAYWDPETFEIKSRPTNNVGQSAILFMSALLRLRDIELLTKATVHSTFKEDALALAEDKLGTEFEIETNAPVSAEFNENPSDLVLIPKRPGYRRAGIFLVSGATSFLEAELLHNEIERKGEGKHLASVALIEGIDKLQFVGTQRFQRAVNRGLPTPFFRGDEAQSMAYISRTLRVPAEMPAPN